MILRNYASNQLSFGSNNSPWIYVTLGHHMYMKTKGNCFILRDVITLCDADYSLRQSGAFLRRFSN